MMHHKSGSVRSDSTRVVEVNRRKTNCRKTRLYCNNIFKTCAGFSLIEKTCNEKMGAEEYCWVITQKAGTVTMQPLKFHSVGSLDFNWIPSYTGCLTTCGHYCRR